MTSDLHSLDEFDEPVGFAPTHFTRLRKPIITEVYDTYWKFATARQEVFFRKLRGLPPPWTQDPYLRRFKFTNAYRAADRVSQFLIKFVIYSDTWSDEDLFLRIVLFKLFNKIETWKSLEDAVGIISAESFDQERYARKLDTLQASGQKIYSGAYIMPSGLSAFGNERKHRNHLALISWMLEKRFPQRLKQQPTMEAAFNLLKSAPTLGNFLAYQLVIDLNYSTLIDYSENEFVMPGPGALSGIAKCFSDRGDFSHQDIIKMMQEKQEHEFSERNLAFESLWGRALQLIDCQNLFCEVDKYARARHPDIEGVGARTKIKQIYRPTGGGIDYFFPPKWGLNEYIRESAAQ